MMYEVRCPSRNHYIGKFDLEPATVHWPRCHRCGMNFEFKARALAVVPVAI
jgi:hypothetical protein